MQSFVLVRKSWIHDAAADAAAATAVSAELPKGVRRLWPLVLFNQSLHVFTSVAGDLARGLLRAT